LETNVKHIEARVASVEQSASFMNDQYESTKQNLPTQASKELINSAKKWNLLLMSLKVKTMNLKTNKMSYNLAVCAKNCSSLVLRNLIRKIEVKKPRLFENNNKLCSPWCSKERIELEKCLEQKLS